MYILFICITIVYSNNKFFKHKLLLKLTILLKMKFTKCVRILITYDYFFSIVEAYYFIIYNDPKLALGLTTGLHIQFLGSVNQQCEGDFF